MERRKEKGEEEVEGRGSRGRGKVEEGKGREKRREEWSQPVRWGDCTLGKIHRIQFHLCPQLIQ